MDHSEEECRKANDSQKGDSYTNVEAKTSGRNESEDSAAEESFCTTEDNTSDAGEDSAAKIEDNAETEGRPSLQKSRVVHRGV